MRRWILLLGFVLFSGLACSAQTGSVTGAWRGIFTDPAGFVYTAEMTLETGPGCKTCAVVGDGSIRGKIVFPETLDIGKVRRDLQYINGWPLSTWC